MKYAYLLPAALIAAGGCVDNNTSIDIDRILSITQTSMCVADPANTVSISSGVLDVGLVNAFAGLRGYTAAPVVRNNMPLRATAGMVDLDAITVQSFDLQMRPDPSIAGAFPASQLGVFTKPVGGPRIEAGGTSTGAMFVEIIPVQIARLVAPAVSPSATTRPSIVVHMRANAVRGDGSTLSSGWYDFPIELCSFCLNGGAPKACPAAPGFAAATVNKSGCSPQQDLPMTCCTQQNALVCGKDVPQM